MTSLSAPIVTSKRKTWVKPLRFLLWVVTIVCIALGIGLSSSATSSDTYVEGSYQALADNADALLTVGVVVGSLNIIWGCTRWFVHCYEGRWSFKKVLGKLIGGGIWRALVFSILGFCILCFASPALVAAVRENAIVANLAYLETSITKLERAFQNGEMSADAYVNYLIDAAYNSSALPSEYQDDKIIMIPDILTVIDENFDALKTDTIFNALNILNLNNIEFGDEPNINATAKTSFLTTNVYADSVTVKTLNKALESSQGHFLVFYTDTGDDAITDGSARDIAEMMEQFIVGYKEQFNLDYHTEQIKFHSGVLNSKRNSMIKVLENNGIDTELLNSAMPIYVVNPFNTSSNVLASYAGRNFDDVKERILIKLGTLLGDENGDLSKFYSSSPVLPFINILPENLNNESLELVVAHEFGHHYATNYCYDNFGSKCSYNDFIDETLPNYAAATVVEQQPKQNLLSYHLDGYIEHTDIAIDNTNTHSGYSTLTFLENYANIVPDGRTKILNALIQEDAYWYLYEQAGESAMSEVLETLAIKNLTNDYGSKYSFYANILPKGESLNCSKVCSERYDTDSEPYFSSSIHYFYFPLSEFKDKIVEIQDHTSPSNYTFSVLGSRNKKWYEVHTHSTENIEKLDFKDYTYYDTIVLAVADHAPSNARSLGFSLNITTKELEEVTEDTEDFFGINGNCLWFYTDGIIDAAKGIVNIFSGIDDELDSAIAEWNVQADQTKAQIGHRKVTIYGQRLAINADFDAVKNSLVHGPHISFGYNESDFRTSITAEFDPFKNMATAYLLTKDSADFYLITATIK